ncbi:hypothetical protein [Rhodobacter sp. TJ_12]|uniref:hypothetical protein n=1 Tax=Rhodobacter sp. TJ_12 TaxID=2029399 RepID=UPI001CC067B4|nr:hypothetical protein [Rhodobacter sp. TJ_12]
MSKIVTFRKNSDKENAAEALKLLEAAWAYYTPEHSAVTESVEEAEASIEHLFEYYAA